MEETVNHPSHYNAYSVETIEMMERIYGTKQTIIFCEMNAFKYRMRAGLKSPKSLMEDLAKEAWYMRRRDELMQKLESGEK